jgi:hypothetical protein
VLKLRVKSHSADGNCTFLVEITLLRVEITLVHSEITLVGVVVADLLFGGEGELTPITTAFVHSKMSFARDHSFVDMTSANTNYPNVLSLHA